MTFKPALDQRVEHRRYAAWGVGVVTKHVDNPYFPHIPTGRSEVDFGSFTREVPDVDLKPAGDGVTSAARPRLVAQQRPGAA